MKKDKKLIPAIIQDHRTKEVLMLAYMNKQSLKKSLEEGTTWFWSRTRGKLWKKGETSGNTQKIKEIKYDCDNDSILVLVEQKGVACHTGNRSCFYRMLTDPENDIDFEKPAVSEDKCAIIGQLYEVISTRISDRKKDSYTYSLHMKGIDEILKKIGEEAIEIILASKHQEKKDIVYEIGDLLYHLLVLMVEKGIEPDIVFDELISRRK
ncbi:MAG: bifunctional phosphoribosyl-AMP cyclohydrolase/phosphoribosyl-ATP diphosphatase HisIE [Actinomycetia bacterium]|nr:bifunctional phosphoribosyl-AMP cyclohydrolase/phosphoribosyl-ATP diphosphatase HisIE [Actinomycetes bacterium]